LFKSAIEAESEPRSASGLRGFFLSSIAVDPQSPSTLDALGGYAIYDMQDPMQDEPSKSR
jgi:hypothetical protein